MSRSSYAKIEGDRSRWGNKIVFSGMVPLTNFTFLGGAWFQESNGVWYVVGPPARAVVEVDVFWSAFVFSVVIGGALAAVLVRRLEVQGKRSGL